jgi:ribosomal protein S18 acetylase RimI-like enzyme
MIYRFLSEEDFPKLLQAFNLAFSDYFVQLKFTEDQLRHLFVERSVDIRRSLGVFANDEMIAFTVNGFGLWNGLETVYDAGTGVIPSFRRQHIAEKMFEFMIPFFREQGIKQYLLEVISENEKAMNLYQKLGFKIIRKVLLVRAGDGLKAKLAPSANLKIVRLKEPNWSELQQFWDGKPTWQSSFSAIEATFSNKVILGAFWDHKCVGYIAFSWNRAVILQFAVEKQHRQKGIGSALLIEVKKFIVEDKKISVMNLDNSLESAMKFFQNKGFNEEVSQFEMLKKL